MSGWKFNPDNPLIHIDPLALKQMLWPHVYFYSQQREIIYAVEESVETYVKAGNKLGR